MTSEFALALSAIVYMDHVKGICSSEVLAQKICTNPARIRKVMGNLKRSGLVVTKEGMDGGYSFAKDAASVTLKDVLCAVGTKAVPPSCRLNSMQAESDCCLEMSRIMEAVYGKLNASCEKALDKITVLEIKNRLYPKED
ncbi:MAG: RrF2 family transcriptional regulator [Christensenellales bacterium]|jgi:Rrf2 family protein